MTRTHPWPSASSPPPAWPQQESDASRDCREVEGGLSRTGRQNQREHDKQVVWLDLVWLGCFPKILCPGGSRPPAPRWWMEARRV